MTLVTNFVTITAGVVDTGGKFAAGVNDATTGINDTGSTFATAGK